jgi:hypothetical protein
VPVQDHYAFERLRQEALRTAFFVRGFLTEFAQPFLKPVKICQGIPHGRQPVGVTRQLAQFTFLYEPASAAPDAVQLLPQPDDAPGRERFDQPGEPLGKAHGLGSVKKP